MLVKRRLEDNEEHLKDASFEDVVEHVKTKFMGNVNFREETVNTNMSIPIDVKIRADFIAHKMYLSVFKTYMAISVFGFFRMIEDYGKQIEEIEDLRLGLLFIDDDNLKSMFYEREKKGKTIVEGIYSKVTFDRLYYQQFREIADIIGYPIASVVRMSWYKTLKVLEEGFLSEAPKGKFDVFIKDFGEMVKFRENLAKMCIKKEG